MPLGRECISATKRSQHGYSRSLTDNNIIARQETSQPEMMSSRLQEQKHMAHSACDMIGGLSMSLARRQGSMQIAFKHKGFLTMPASTSAPVLLTISWYHSKGIYITEPVSVAPVNGVSILVCLRCLHHLRPALQPFQPSRPSWTALRLLSLPSLSASPTARRPHIASP